MSHPLARGLNELTAALTALRIPFVVGGSLASSAHGVQRREREGLAGRRDKARLDNDMGAAHLQTQKFRLLSSSRGCADHPSEGRITRSKPSGNCSAIY